MAVSYTGNLQDSVLVGGLGYGRSINSVRLAAEERRDALLNMDGESISDDFVRIRLGLAGGPSYGIDNFKKMSGGGSIFNQTFITGLDDDHTVGRALANTTLASPITEASFDSPSAISSGEEPYDILTNEVVRNLLGISLSSISLSGGEPYNKDTLDLYRSGIGITNFFGHSPSPPSRHNFTSFVSPDTGSTVSYEDGIFATEELAWTDIGATQGNVSSLLTSKLSGSDQTITTGFSAAISYQYDWIVHEDGFETDDFYSQIKVEQNSSTNHRQPMVATPTFKDSDDAAATGSTKIAGRINFTPRSGTIVDDIEHTLSTFDVEDTLKALDDASFTGQLSAIPFNGADNVIWAASDYTNCFPSQATIT